MQRAKNGKSCFGNIYYEPVRASGNNMRTSFFTSWYLLCFTVIALMMASCGRPVIQNGQASFYADKFVGRKTANGEIFRQRKRTAAHRTLPFGTKVKVKNLSNGRTVKVRINDRGPYAAGRIIDLSKKAARKLGMVKQGVSNVQIRYKQK